MRGLLVLLGAGVFGSSFAAGPSRLVFPGDKIGIECSEPELCVSRVVNPDGTILLPILGSVGVATLNTGEIEGKLERMAREQGEGLSTISVSTCFLRGAPIEIQGAVRHPMKFRFTHAPDLKRLVEIADPTDQGDCSRIEISHADGKFETVALKQTHPLLDGDRVTIPFATQGRTVEVTGGVQNPAHLILQGEMTVSDALGAAGGVAARGNPDRIEVIRLGEAIPIRLPDDSRFELEPGDEVRVEVKESIRHVLVQGKVNHPGLVDYRPGMTLTQAIAAAGGISELNRSDLVWLSQAMEGSKPRVKLSLRYLYSHRIPDPALLEDEIIQVGPSEIAKKR